MNEVSGAGSTPESFIYAVRSVRSAGTRSVAGDCRGHRPVACAAAVASHFPGAAADCGPVAAACPGGSARQGGARAFADTMGRRKNEAVREVRRSRNRRARGSTVRLPRKRKASLESCVVPRVFVGARRSQNCPCVQSRREPPSRAACRRGPPRPVGALAMANCWRG